MQSDDAKRLLRRRVIEPIGSRADVVIDPVTGRFATPTVDSLVRRRNRKAKRRVVIRLNRGSSSK
jgi:hypothetical protein